MEAKQMSLWGIGPYFVALSILIVLGFLYLSMRFDLFVTSIIIRIPLIIIGILLMLFGFLLWRPAARTIDDCIRAGILAQQGVYGMVRNPIYSGFLFFLTGICVALFSPLMLPVPFIMYGLLKGMLRKEDKVLMEAFGSPYLAYKKRVNQILPRPSKILAAWFYPVDTVRYDDKLFILRDGDVNVFVYTDGTDYICIDAGYNADHLRQQCAQLALDPTRVSTVFLTHTDRDHRDGLPLFKEAEVCLSRAEEPMINGQARRKLHYRNEPLGRPYHALEDGETRVIGSIKVRAIVTPGHTTGHTVYIVDDRYLFTGDAVIYQNGFFKVFYKPINRHHADAVISAEKIKQLIQQDIDLVCTAHTGVIKV